MTVPLVPCSNRALVDEIAGVVGFRYDPCDMGCYGEALPGPARPLCLPHELAIGSLRELLRELSPEPDERQRLLDDLLTRWIRDSKDPSTP